MTTAYSLAPVAFDRRGNVLPCDVTDNYDTCGNVVVYSIRAALNFLEGIERGLATRGCGEGHVASKAYRTRAYAYTGDGYRQVRPMFWTIRWDGIVREVWSVARKVMVFERGTSVHQPDWAQLRRDELAARYTAEAEARRPAPTQKAETVTIRVIFTPLNTETTFPAKYYGTPMGINTVTWYQAVDRDANADIAGWTVSRNHRSEDFVVNGPRGVIESVASLEAAAEYISQAFAASPVVPAPPTASAPIVASTLPTDSLVRLVLQCWTWDDSRPMWQLVKTSHADASAYFKALPEAERRTYAAEVLDAGGWNLSRARQTLT